MYCIWLVERVARVSLNNQSEVEQNQKIWDYFGHNWKFLLKLEDNALGILPRYLISIASRGTKLKVIITTN